MRSLRFRLIVIVAVLLAAGLAMADAITYTQLRSYLVDRIDRTIAGSADALATTMQRNGGPDPTDFVTLRATIPGARLGIADDSGLTRWQALAASGTGTGDADDGAADAAAPPPQVPASRLGRDDAFTLRGPTGIDYRIHVEQFRGEYVLVAAPLTDISNTLHRLLMVEILVSAAVVAAGVVGATLLVRVGLRPLARIEGTAAAIAAGDLGRRVEEDPRTEVGRLGAALNAMLSQIESAFAERTRSEERLRRFVADASHELRTPLTSIRAYAELFERGARDRPEDLARAMSGIEREAGRMGRLVDDLLLLAGLDEGRPLARADVPLARLVSEAVDAARLVDPERSWALDAEPVTVDGDAARLHQVVDNLLANVRSHTPPGTHARIGVHAVGDLAVVSVADDGPGLAPEHLERVFQRFFRADPSRSRSAGGTGLGLAIAHAIARAHGGELTVRSRPGEGTTFELRLPRVADHSTPVSSPLSGGAQGR